MVYADDSYQISLTQLAQSGKIEALSHWLNSLLAPYRLFARVSLIRDGYLRILVELQPTANRDATATAFRNRLVRYICHQLWKLNSPALDGALVLARYVGQPKVLWKQSVRIVSPARRAHIANSPQAVKQRLKSASRQRKNFQTLRSMLISGSSIAAFVLGCWLGYADSPSEQTQASAVITHLTRGETKVQAALETVPVVKATGRNAEPAVSLMFGGDVSFGENYDSHVGNNNAWSLSNLEPLRQADISMVNLDTPMTEATQALGGKKVNSKTSPDRVNVLLSGGVGVVNLANDNSMDYQAMGLSETLTTLDKSGIKAVGAGRNATEARRPVVMEVKGQRVAYLGYYDSDLHAATEQLAGTNPRRNDRIAADIKAIRDQVDWVVVNYHWGDELAKYPGDWQIDLARFTIDQGADMVVGHHAKVLQGAEVYRGRPIVYSLGNFIFGGKSTDKTASDYDTAVLKVGLNNKQMRIEFVPVEVRNFQARVMSGDQAKQILNQISNVSDIFEEPLNGSMVLDAKTNTVTQLKDAGKGADPKSMTETPGEANVDQPTAAPTITAPILNEPKSRVEAPISPGSTPRSTDSATPNASPKDSTWNPNSFINQPTTTPTTGPQGNANNEPAHAEPAHAEPALTLKLPVPNTLQPMKRRFAQVN